MTCPECNSRNVESEWNDRYEKMEYSCNNCGCLWQEATKIEIIEHGLVP